MNTHTESHTKPAGHTPGPWHVTRTHQGMLTDKFRDFPFAIDGENFRPALILGDGRLNAGTAEANARLIAAAPELLEALKITLSALREASSNLPPIHRGEAGSHCENGPAIVSAYWQEMKQARALLATLNA